MGAGAKGKAIRAKRCCKIARLATCDSSAVAKKPWLARAGASRVQFVVRLFKQTSTSASALAVAIVALLARIHRSDGRWR